MSMQKLSCALLCVFGASFSASVLANHETGPRPHSHQHSQYSPALSTWLSAGWGFGGDELGRFQSGDGSIDKIQAGKGGHFAAGVMLAMDPWSNLRFSGGYQRGSLSKLNGDTAFDSVQFGASVLRTHRRHEFGAGLTLHTGVRYDCNFVNVCADEVEFDAAVGYTLEYAVRPGYQYGGRQRGGYGSSRGLRLGVRYTSIEYTPKIGGEPIDGSSLGGFVGVVF